MLLDLAGVDPRTDVAARSFALLLTGDEYELRDRVFVEITWYDRYNPTRGVRTSEFTYLRKFSMLPRVFIPRDIIDQPAARPVRGGGTTSITPPRSSTTAARTPRTPGRSGRPSSRDTA